MAAVGLEPAPAEAHDEQLRLRFYATRVEPDLSAPFFQRGGSLGSACARAETDFSVTGAEFCTSKIVNDTASSVEVALPPSMYTRNPKTGAVRISTRARLNITTARVAAAINGTIAGTISGQGSVPIYELFTEALTKKPAAEPTAASATGAATLPTPVEEVHIALPFQQVAMNYGNWAAHSAVVGIAGPTVLAKDLTTGAYTESQDIEFVQNDEGEKIMALAEPTLQAIYDAAWKLRKSVVYAGSPNLTKSVMRVPSGFNGGGFCLASSVNDAPVSQSNETIEDLLAAGVAMVIDSAAERQRLLDELATPSFTATVEHAQTLGTALSYMQGHQKPYRVDGTPVMKPTGAEMVLSESWRFEAAKRRADDCDGSAADVEAVIQACERAEEAMPGKFVYMRAVANSIGAHYVHGVSILGANAGHADAANEEATTLTGHAVCIGIPKTQALIALKRGAEYEVDGVAPLSEELRRKVYTARHAALYPKALVRRMPPKERAVFDSMESMENFIETKMPAAVGAQPLFFEGTTPCSARGFTHSATERDERAKVFASDKEIGTSFAPNILRMSKLLDTSPTGKHAFYSEFVELLVSPTSGLMTDEELRGLDSATCQLVFCKPTTGKPVTVAGASPQDLATADFAIVPLWRTGKKLSKIVDLAHEESVMNAIPRRAGPDQLSAAEAERLDQSIAALTALGKGLATDTPVGERTGHPMLYMASFDSMLHNPAAIAHFCKVVTERGGSVGDVTIHKVRGVATKPATTEGAVGEDAGVFAQVNLWVS